MLDELLGRATLKERIEALEQERDDLRQQLEAESERRAAAITDRQEAQQQVNRLQDKIAELEDRVERSQSASKDRSFRRRERMTGTRLERVLDRLDSFESDAESALTAFVTEGQVSEHVGDAFGDRAALISRASPCYALTDDASLCSVALSPPIHPDPFLEWGSGFDLDRRHFEPTGRFTLALVRSDLFAMGEYRSRDRVAFHGFDSELGSNHSKGGFSQARFERLRDEQIDDHLDRCRAALAERNTERLYVVGEQSILGGVDADADATAAVDATGDPEAALEDAFRDFWTTTLYGI